MGVKNEYTAYKAISPKLRVYLGAGFIFLGLGLLFGAMSIPFGFESFTIKYKFGLDKTFLRTGQTAAMAAGCLLMLQLVLNGRLKILDRIFSINRLTTCHRWNGMAIAMLVLIHATLILISEGRDILDPTIKNWPQYAGLFLLITVCGIVISARWRRAIGLSYTLWRFFHGKFTHMAVGVFAVHALYACDTYGYAVPRGLLLGSLVIYVLLFLRLKLNRIIQGRSCNVLNVSPASIDAFSIALIAEDGKPFAYAPGQFIFIRFKSKGISGEEHPFTISSSPTGTPEIFLTIRSAGDWTSNIHRLKPGDKASVNGPFGLFGNLNLKSCPEIIMIAGGIGITPMLSLLGDMARRKDMRPITLLWSNRTHAHIVLPELIAEFQRRLSRLRVIHILTREPEYEGEKGRLDLFKIEKLLSGCSRQSRTFICGPPEMMTSCRRSLISLGFRRRSFVMERFSL